MTRSTQARARISAVVAAVALAAVIGGCTSRTEVVVTLAATPPASTQDATVTIAGHVEPQTTRLSARVGSGPWSAVSLRRGDFSYVATLQPGANAILLRAGNRGGSGAADKTLKISYVPKLPLAWRAPADGASVAASYVSVEGSTTPGATGTVNDAPLSIQADGSFRTRVRLGSGSTRLVLRLSAAGHPPREEVRSVTRVESPAAYKASCRPAQPRVLLNNPERYGGKRITVAGKVVDVTGNAPGVTLLLAIGKGGVSNGRIVVDYVQSGNVGLGDTVRVWGVGRGYNTFAGGEDSFPAITAQFLSVLR